MANESCWPCQNYRANGCEIEKDSNPLACSDFVREPGHDMQEAIDSGIINGDD